MNKLKLENCEMLSEGERFDDTVLAYDKKDNSIFYLFVEDEVVAEAESDLLKGNIMPFTAYFNEFHANILEQWLVLHNKPVPDYLPYRENNFM